MKSRREFTAGALLSVAIVLVALALALAGCGGSSGTTTTSPAGPTTTVAPTTSSAVSTTSSSTTTTSAAPTTTSSASAPSADRQAAEAYFAAMAPTIDKDYQGLQGFKQAMTQWGQTYGNTDLTTNRKAWEALSLIVQQAIPVEREIIQGYEAVTPPEAFRTAHATLLDNNRLGNTWAEGLVAAIKANRPTRDLLSMITAGSPGPSNTQVLAEFRSAAARVGIELPTKLIGAYTESTDSGGVTA